MSSSYLLFQPTQLPLTLEVLVRNADNITQNLPADSAAIQLLEQVFGSLAWEDNEAKAELHGNWYEIHLPAGARTTISLRCSMRVGHAPMIQELCDKTGWIAFDDHGMCYQLGRAPFDACAK